MINAIAMSDLAQKHPELAQALDDMKGQLLIVLIKRMGGKVAIPVAEVDDTAQDLLAFGIVDGVFHFEARKKS